MRFKEFYYLSEGLIDVPKEYIKSFIDSHINEIKSKIKETNAKKYETFIDDNLIINNQEIPITIVPTIPNSEAYMSVDLKKGMDIYLDAKNLIGMLNNKDFSDFLFSSFIHEITHLVDKGAFEKSAAPNSQDDYDQYLNSDREFPAYANEMINKINSKTDEEKQAIIMDLKWGNPLIDDEIQDFISRLNKKNKHKFINYIVKAIHK